MAIELTLHNLNREKRKWFICKAFETYSQGGSCISTTHTITHGKGDSCRYVTPRIHVFYFSKFLSGLL